MGQEYSSVNLRNLPSTAVGLESAQESGYPVHMAEVFSVGVILKNRWATVEWPYPEELKDYFAWRLPNYQFTPAGRNGWDGWISLVDGNRIPTGLFLVRKKTVESETCIRFEIQDRRKHLSFAGTIPKTVGAFTVRRDQREALEAMRDMSYTGGVILNATGTGKTALAGFFLHMLDRKKHSTVFVNDELTLLHQSQEELEGILGEPVGIVGESQFRPGRVTVATIQTLSQHFVRDDFREWARSIDVFFLDEIHDCLNRRAEDFMKQVNPMAVYGLTATLNMKDPNIRTRVFALAGPRLYSYTYEAGRDDKVLAKGVVIGLDRKADMVAGKESYVTDYGAYIVRDEQRNRIIVDAAREAVRRGNPTVILVQRVAHVKLLSKMLQDIPHMTVYGAKDSVERRKAKRLMEAGKLPLIIANKVFRKGINIKRISCIVEASGIGKEEDTIQKFGRGTRNVEGKAGLIYVDVGDVADKLRNRFARATVERRKALAGLGVPVWTAKAGEPIRKTFAKAVKLLAL